MAKKPTRLHAPPRACRLPRWIQWVSLLVIVLAAGAAVLVSVDFDGGPRRAARPPALPKPLDKMTAEDLAALTDSQLEAMDPLVIDLIVARGIPGLETLDIGKYVAVVDDWAKRIDAANRASERISKDEPTYKVSREFWMAGGMAVMLAGPAFGISYTTENLTPGKPEQQFVHGLIDKKTGTCATMPVLYMAIGHRLGWPIHAVVSRDHMWARWDDGIPKGKGGIRFNLEATNARSSGGEGSFASLTDVEYAKWLGTPRSVIASGSDFTSLTARQSLGVFLQGRAAYWARRGLRGKAMDDLELAIRCFHQNVDIRGCLVAIISPGWVAPIFQQPVDPRLNPNATLDGNFWRTSRSHRNKPQFYGQPTTPPAPIDPDFSFISSP